MRKKRSRIDLGILNSQGISLSEALGMQLSDLPKPEPKTPDNQADERKIAVTFRSRIRLSLEKKGRAGKIVTKISGINPAANSSSLLIKTLKQELGCGANTEGEFVFFQGDQRQRLYDSLHNKGYTNVKII